MSDFAFKSNLKRLIVEEKEGKESSGTIETLLFGTGETNNTSTKSSNKSHVSLELKKFKKGVDGLENTSETNVQEMLPTSEIAKITKTSDVVSGIYEGGFKLWECAIDLVQFLTTLKHQINSNISIHASASNMNNVDMDLEREVQTVSSKMFEGSKVLEVKL